jgi:hypothetical protein
VLPQHGWAAEGPDLSGFAALVEGRLVDFLEAPEVTLLDGRGTESAFGGVTSRDLRVVLPDGRVLTEGPDGTMSVAAPPLARDGLARWGLTWVDAW